MISLLLESKLYDPEPELSRIAAFVAPDWDREYFNHPDLRVDSNQFIERFHFRYVLLLVQRFS